MWRAVVLGIILVSPLHAGMPIVDRPITTIVIHHTAGTETTVDQIRREHKRREFKDIAYHYVVFPNGKAEGGRSVHKEGAGVFGRHQGFIEIVMIGELHKRPPTRAQFTRATQLAAKFCLTYNLPYTRVRGHNEVAADGHGTLCPGMDMKDFRVQVNNEMISLKNNK